MGSLDVEVRPASPYRLPRGSSDGTRFLGTFTLTVDRLLGR